MRVQRYTSTEEARKKIKRSSIIFSAFFFETVKEVDDFKALYEKTKASLFAYKKVELLPCALNKQLYLVMSLMKYKTATELRKPIADLKVGECFYLYDQKHFIKVKLTKYILLKNEITYKHRYEYQLD